jgi:hypothetical protein
MPDIRITVDGQRAYTTDLAAAEHGMTYEAMRKLLHRAAVEPVARLWRQPVYSAKDIRAALANRPGRGAPGVKRVHKPD